MTLLTPLALFAALLAIPILLLYMLRLRRREMLVSSHFLWRQVVHDTEANTPWQRLRRNLLLLLQLLILALLVLALARPAQVVETISAGKTIILLDASASMNATDMNGGTRFEAAKAEALRIINGLGVRDELSLVRVGSVTEPLMGYTSDVNALRAALTSAQPSSGAGDWQTALTLAAAGAAGAENFNIIVISDGNIPASAGKLPENIPQPTYIPIGTSSANLAISALATRTLPAQDPQLFAQVQNYGTAEVPLSLVVRLDGELWESASATLAPESQQAFIFTIDRAFTTIEAQLVLPPEVKDYLTLDNHAFATATTSGTRRVLVMAEKDNLFLEQVFRSLPNVATFRGDTTRRLPTQAYDLYVFDGWLPDILPQGDMLIINPPRSTPLFELGDVTENQRGLTVTDPLHPLMLFVDFGSVNLRAFRPLTADWARPLVTAEGGTLFAAGDINGQQIALLPFDLRDSDLPLQVAFPILMANLLDWFTPSNVLSQTEGVQVGDAVALRPPVNTTQLSVMLPDGTVRELALNADNLVFAETQQLGLYTVNIATAQGTQVYPLAINLFNDEIRIAPQPVLAIGGGVVERAEDAQLSLREFWWWLALLALGVLLLEWVLYQRRMQIPTRAVAPIRRSTAR